MREFGDEWIVLKWGVCYDRESLGKIKCPPFREYEFFLEAAVSTLAFVGEHKVGVSAMFKDAAYSSKTVEVGRYSYPDDPDAFNPDDFVATAEKAVESSSGRAECVMMAYVEFEPVKTAPEKFYRDVASLAEFFNGGMIPAYSFKLVSETRGDAEIYADGWTSPKDLEKAYAVAYGETDGVAERMDEMRDSWKKWAEETVAKMCSALGSGRLVSTDAPVSYRLLGTSYFEHERKDSASPGKDRCVRADVEVSVGEVPPSGWRPKKPMNGEFLGDVKARAFKNVPRRLTDNFRVIVVLRFKKQPSADRDNFVTNAAFWSPNGGKFVEVFNCYTGKPIPGLYKLDRPDDRLYVAIATSKGTLRAKNRPYFAEDEFLEGSGL